MPMGTYTKIKVIMLYTLNNAEYLAYMNSVLALLPPPSGGEEDRPDELSLDKEVQASGAPDIGLSKEFVNAMEKDVLALADVVDESRISQETEKAELHEKNRDNLVVYITTRISRAGTLPLEAERDAGKYLYKVIKPYIGIARLPVAQESAKIQGLLIDLRKDENISYVETLGLAAYLDELEKENNAYISLTANGHRTGQPTRRKAVRFCASGSTDIMKIWSCWHNPTALPYLRRRQRHLSTT